MVAVLKWALKHSQQSTSPKFQHTMFPHFRTVLVNAVESDSFPAYCIELISCSSPRSDATVPLKMSKLFQTCSWKCYKMTTILAVYLHSDLGSISEVVTRWQEVFCEMSERIDLFHSKSFQNVSYDFCRWMFCTQFLAHFLRGQIAGTGTPVHQNNQLPQITVYRYNTHFYLWSLDTAIHDKYLSIIIIIIKKKTLQYFSLAGVTLGGQLSRWNLCSSTGSYSFSSVALARSWTIILTVWPVFHNTLTLVSTL